MATKFNAHLGRYCLKLGRNYVLVRLDRINGTNNFTKTKASIPFRGRDFPGIVKSNMKPNLIYQVERVNNLI